MVDREEAYDWPVCYFVFAQLGPSAMRTQDLQSISEWVILLSKTSCLIDAWPSLQRAVGFHHLWQTVQGRAFAGPT